MTDPEGTDTISYDDLDRVAQVSRDTGWIETYAYNALGALKINAGVVLDDQRQVLGGVNGQTADAGIPNTFNSQSVTIDGEGKITNLAGTALTYNGHGYVESVGGGGAVEYDSFMRIVTSPGFGEKYTYDGRTAVGSGSSRAGSGRRRTRGSTTGSIIHWSTRTRAGIGSTMR